MPALKLIIGILMAFVTMCAIISNALVLIVICWNRSLKRPLNVFLFNLAAADTGMACTCIPYAIGQILFKNKDLTSTFCHLSAFLVTLFMTATVLGIMAMCLYQYIMVTGPLESTVSGFQNIIFLILSWAMAIGLAAGPLFHWGKYELSVSIFGCVYEEVGKLQYLSYNCTLMFIGYIFPLILLAFCYCSILFAIRDSDTRIAKGWIIASISTDNSCIETGKRRIVTATLLSFLSFVLFRTPLFIAILLDTFKFAGTKWLMLADQIAFWALYFQAATDPFVYAFQQGEYCRTLREIGNVLKQGIVECCCCYRVERGEKNEHRKEALEIIDEE